jgi:hypothetical protein
LIGTLVPPKFVVIGDRGYLPRAFFLGSIEKKSDYGKKSGSSESKKKKHGGETFRSRPGGRLDAGWRWRSRDFDHRLSDGLIKPYFYLLKAPV